MLLIWSKRTADMSKDLCGSLSQRLKMLLHVREEQFERAAVMIMSDDSSRDAPEPFDAVGIRIIGRRIHQIQLVLELAEQAAHEQGASRSVGLQIVGNHDGHPSTLRGTSHGGTHLLTEHISGASRSNSAIEPAIAPVHQAEAIDLAIVPRRFDQTLSTPSFEAPDTREGRVKGHLQFILQIQVSAWHQREQFRQVGGKLIPQVSLNQVVDG
jgi:hypothetical protein